VRFHEYRIRTRGQPQLLVAADVIGVHMGIDHMGDLHAFLSGYGIR
jgi:hypothetical protein